jgi:hypothetical protein
MQDLLTLSKSASDADTYKAICDLIDMDEFCNYMALEFYLRNSDWPQNNLKAWRPRREDGRFRFVLYDLDGFDWTSSPFTDFANKRIHTFHRLYGEPVQYITKEIEVVTIFLNLLNNDTFRKKFIDTFCIMGGSVYQPSKVSAIINEMREYLSQGWWVSPDGTANDLINKISST